MTLALLALASSPPALFVRVSTVDVTPPEPLPLGGYTERRRALFEPGGERLTCRTVVFEQGSRRVAVAWLEALTVPESLRDAVRERIPGDVGLMLVASHTHCAPDSQMLNARMTFSIPGIAPYDRAWARWYADRVADGVNRALRARAYRVETVRMRTAEPGLNRARREGARPDPRATAIEFGPARIVHYAAHATLLGADVRTLHGDWPGEVARRLGGPVLIGPIGDVSPAVGGSGEGVEKVASFGEIFTDRLSRGRLRRATPGELRWVVEAVRLDPVVPHPEFAAANGVPEPIAATLAARFAADSAFVSLLVVGGLLLVGVPGEPTAEVGARIRLAAQAAGFPHCLVVSLANGWVGYVLTAEDYDRGGYEARLAFHGRGTADRILEAVRTGLRRLGHRGLTARSWLGHRR